MQDESVSTPGDQPAQPQQAPPPISPELQALISFLQSQQTEAGRIAATENQAHRDYFKNLYEESTKSFRVLVLGASAVMLFLGINTYEGAQQIAKAAAKKAATVEVQNEFDNKKEIKTMVADAARSATSTADQRAGQRSSVGSLGSRDREHPRKARC
jgi:hypothetical protein